MKHVSDTVVANVPIPKFVRARHKTLTNFGIGTLAAPLTGEAPGLARRLDAGRE